MDIPRPDNFNETYLYEGMLVYSPGLQRSVLGEACKSFPERRMMVRS